MTLPESAGMQGGNHSCELEDAPGVEDSVQV